MDCDKVKLFLFLLLLSNERVAFSQSPNTQVLIHPESRLIPVGTVAMFTCQFQNVADQDIVYWKINLTEASSLDNVENVRMRGFFIAETTTATESANGNTVTSMMMTVNGSFSGINNTKIQCKSLFDVHSQIATLLTIAGAPIQPNPLIEHENASSILLKWSPSFLWPGYYITTYNISVKNHSDESITYYQMNSSSFRDAVVLFTYSQTNYHQCALFTFGITPVHSEVGIQSYSLQGGYWYSPGNFSVIPIVLFKADGTPVVRARIVPSPLICSFQAVNYTLVVEDRERTFAITKGPVSHSGGEEFEHEIKSQHFKMKQEYLMTVTVDTSFEISSASYVFNTYIDPDLEATFEPCTTGIMIESKRDHADSVFKYKVAMGVCLSLVVVMLFTLISVLVCLLIRCQKKRSREKTFNESTNRVQNAMVHNPIYDGPVYDSVAETHFDSLASVTVKQDLSLSNISQSQSPCNSPPPCAARTGSLTPPNALQDSSQKNVRYLDQPIHPRSLSLVPSSKSLDNSLNPRSTSVCATAATTRVMALKKNGKERNKLHLTLTLNNENDVSIENPATTAPRQVLMVKESSSSHAVHAVPGSGKSMTSVSNTATPRLDMDEHYTVMSPIKIGGSLHLNTKVIELSPEDTEKYRE